MKIKEYYSLKQELESKEKDLQTAEYEYNSIISQEPYMAGRLKGRQRRMHILRGEINSLRKRINSMMNKDTAEILRLSGFTVDASPKEELIKYAEKTKDPEYIKHVKGLTNQSTINARLQWHRQKENDAEEEWITMNGAHVKIEEGQSKEKAAKEFISEKGGDPAPEGGKSKSTTPNKEGSEPNIKSTKGKAKSKSKWDEDKVDDDLLRDIFGEDAEYTDPTEPTSVEEAKKFYQSFSPSELKEEIASYRGMRAELRENWQDSDIVDKPERDWYDTQEEYEIDYNTYLKGRAIYKAVMADYNNNLKALKELQENSTGTKDAYNPSDWESNPRHKWTVASIKNELDKVKHRIDMNRQRIPQLRSMVNSGQFGSSTLKELKEEEADYQANQMKVKQLVSMMQRAQGQKDSCGAKDDDATEGGAIEQYGKDGGPGSGVKGHTTSKEPSYNSRSGYNFEEPKVIEEAIKKVKASGHADPYYLSGLEQALQRSKKERGIKDECGEKIYTKGTEDSCTKDLNPSDYDETMTTSEARQYWNKYHNSDPILKDYKSFEEWYRESKMNGYIKDSDPKVAEAESVINLCGGVK